MVVAFLLQGLAMGFANGMLPGPTMVLAIAAALRGGFRNGAAVAAAPLLTDLPIVTICLLLVSRVSETVTGLLAIAGACVLLFFAYEAFRDARTVTLASLRAGAVHAPSVTHSLRQGIVANTLNPSPWMFWITIGGPLLRQSWSHGVAASAAFLIGFYALLVGSKLGMAWAVGAGRSRLSDRGYRGILAAAGVLLVGLALSLVRAGVHSLA